jgi:hypothetical protein
LGCFLGEQIGEDSCDALIRRGDSGGDSGGNSANHRGSSRRDIIKANGGENRICSHVTRPVDGVAADDSEAYRCHKGYSKADHYLFAGGVYILEGVIQAIGV